MSTQSANNAGIEHVIAKKDVYGKWTVSVLIRFRSRYKAYQRTIGHFPLSGDYYATISSQNEVVREVARRLFPKATF